jgi:transposase
MNTSPTLGIDMAAPTFVAALWFDSHRVVKSQFANHGGGFRQLRTWLKRHGVGLLRVGIESTSTYAEALAQWLHQSGHAVYLLNPARVAYYARSVGQGNKTDPADASTIAAFVARHELTRWQPPAPEQKTLRSLTRVRAQLIDCRLQLSNQLRTADPDAAPHLRAILRQVAAQLLALDRQIKTHVESVPQLATQVRRLRTMKGIGLTTAAIIVAELPPITTDSDPRALCAWAGLVPRRWQSGKTEYPARLSRRGNCHLRQALHMPALVAKRYNPLLRHFAQRLSANGKSHGAIIGAVAHKMLLILIALLRSNSDFDPLRAQKNT